MKHQFTAKRTDQRCNLVQEKLIHHRIPLYEKIAKNYGYTIEMTDVPAIRDDKDFIEVISTVIESKKK